MRIDKAPFLALAVLMAASMGLAAAVSSLVSPVFRATSRVEFNPEITPAKSAEPSPAAAFRTQAEIIESDRVLQIAAQELGSASIEQLKEAVSAYWVEGTRILDIQVERPKAQESKLWADAVTKSYVEFRRATAVSNSASARRLLNRGIATAQTQLSSLEAEINEKPPNLAELVAQKQQLQAQMSALQEEMKALPESAAVVKGPVNVLSQARTPKEPIAPKRAKNVAFAGMGAMAVGAPLALMAQRSRKFGRSERIPNPKKSPRPFSMPGKAGSPGSRVEPSGEVVSRIQALDDRLSSVLDHMDESLKARLTPGKELEEGQEKALANLFSQKLDDRLSSVLARTEESLRASLESMLQDWQDRGHVVDGDPVGLGQALHGGEAKLAADTSLQERQQALEASLQRMHEQALERLGAQVQNLASTLNVMVDGATSVFKSEEANLSDLYVRTREGILDSLHSESAEMAKRLGVLNHELFQRFGRMVLQLSQGLQELKEEMVERTLAGQKGIANRLESVDVKLDGERGLTASVAGLSEQLTSDLEGLKAKVSTVVEKINGKSGEGALISRHEVTERLRTVDRESSERLGEIALRLSQALDAVRREVSDRMSTEERKISAMIDSLEATTAVYASQVARGMSGLKDQLERAIDTAELKSTRLSSDIKKLVAEGGRSEAAKSASALQRRLEELSAEFTQGFVGLEASLSKKIAAHQQGVSRKLASVEAKVEDESSGVSRKLSSRLKTIENAISALDDSEKNGSTPAGQKRVSGSKVVRSQRKSSVKPASSQEATGRTKRPGGRQPKV